MRVFPVLLDSRPAYLTGCKTPSSLLRMPLGTGTLLGHLCSRFSKVSPNPVTILPTFEPEAGYERTMREACPTLGAVVLAGCFTERISAHEPSDWLLVADPSNYPAGGWDFGPLMSDLGADPRMVRHLVTLDTTSTGTKEYVLSDADGRVQRIQRYYEAVTWPFASGVSCSLLPVACTLLLKSISFMSLSELRQVLTSVGVPSRDVPLPGDAFDLTDERGLLSLTERFVLDSVSKTANARQSPRGRGAYVGTGCSVPPSARLVGPVILHGGVVLEENATVIGPALIGAGSRVGRNAIVAQCLVTPGTVVPDDTMVRHRVVSDQFASGGAPAPPAVDRRTAGPTAWQRTVPFVLRDEQPRRLLYASFKSIPEAIIAFLGLLLLSPLLVVIAALIKLGSRGPVLYVDEREGKDGRPFRCWKFRTMYAGADVQQPGLYAKNQVDGPQFKLLADPRVTPIGRLLRPMSLDELPQLINVMLGQMSLVGPRPSPFRENQVCVQWRQGRLSVRPGMTGLWQLCRHDRTHGDFHQWIYYDLLYVKHISLWLDLKILAATLLTGGKWTVRLSRLIPEHTLNETD